MSIGIGLMAAPEFDKGTLARTLIGPCGQVTGLPDRRQAYGPSPLVKFLHSQRCRAHGHRDAFAPIKNAAEKSLRDRPFGQAPDQGRPIQDQAAAGPGKTRATLRAGADDWPAAAAKAFHWLTQSPEHR